MKLSEKTLEILRNYATINPSMLFKQGNVISTITHPAKHVYSKAVVEETFPRDFAIYDLSRFLATLSLVSNPNIVNFTSEQLVINGDDGSEVLYTFSEPTMINGSSYKDIPIVSPVAKFSLDNVMQIIKACNVMQLPNVIVEISGGKGNIYAGDAKKANRDAYKVNIGRFDPNIECRCSFEIEKLKLLPRQYECTIGQDSRFIHFKNEKLEYFIACDMVK
jgi:hypothetical protein